MADWSFRSSSYMLNMFRPREKMKYMVRDTRDHILEAFETQGIYPYGEVYPGWFKKNEERKQRGWSYSTGRAASDSRFSLRFGGTSSDQFPATTLINFTAPFELGYVDYGVGKNRKVREIDRKHPAKRGQRYYTWNPKAKKTHRPVYRKEMRHLARRAERYMTTFSGRLYEAYVLKGLDDMVKYSGTKNDSTFGLTFSNLTVKRNGG